MNTVGGHYCACSDPELSLAPDNRHCVGMKCFAGHKYNVDLIMSLGKKVSVNFSG